MTLIPTTLSEPMKAGGAALFGAGTAGVGAITENVWVMLAGAAIGAGGVAWTFGMWLRDHTFSYLRQQNQELASELQRLSEEVARLRHRE